MSTTQTPRYIVTGFADGFHVRGRPHPYEEEAQPDWLLDLVDEYTSFRRVPTTVVRHPFRLEVSGGDGPEEHINFADFRRLTARVAGRLLCRWHPPIRYWEDEVHDYDTGRQVGVWRGRLAWVIRRAVWPLTRPVHAEWRRLLGAVDPTVLAVHRKVFAAAFGCRNAVRVFPPEFFCHRYVVKDVLAFRAAAIAASVYAPDDDHKYSQRYSPPGFDALMARMADWKGVFSPTGTGYGPLNRTLTALPGGVPAGLLLDLNTFTLPRPITDRLELIAAIVAHRTDHRRNTHVCLHATAHQVRELVRRVAAHLNHPISHRRWEHVAQALDFVLDYPDEHHGNLVGLAEKAIRWHRDERTATAARIVAYHGHDAPLERPPVPPPALPGVRFLATVGDLCREGEEMEHCIASYARKALRGESYLFHVEHGGERASVEVGCFGGVRQACGPRNGHNAACDWGRRVLRRWGRVVREAELAAMEARVAGTAAAGTAAAGTAAAG